MVKGEKHAKKTKQRYTELHQKQARLGLGVSLISFSVILRFISTCEADTAVITSKY